MENFPAGSVKAHMKAEAIDSALSFEVERHAEWMQLRFDYGKPRTWRQLVVRDPAGRLRYTHFDVVEPRSALLHRDPDLTGVTAVAGDIIPGRWTVEFLRNVPGQFELEWVIGDGPIPGEAGIRDEDRDVWSEGEEAGRNAELNRYDWKACQATGRRWYKGDLHGHTTLSDGSLSPREMTRQAEARGLDFFFVTEHNVLPASWPKGKPLVIPGMEFTSFGKGDWNALGLPGWIDCWGTGLEDGGMHSQEGQNRMMEEAASRGAVRTFNHPLAGRFAWRYPESPLRFVDLLEIWNSPTKKSTPGLTDRTMVLWNLLWNDGYRVPGVGGSDTHLRPDQSYEEGCPPDTIGDPASYVLADRLTPIDILNGLRAGHVYVSRGPELEVSIQAGGRTFTFGDDLTEALDGSEDGNVRYRLTVMHAKGAKLRVVENGEVIDTQPIETDRWELDQTFSWKERTYVWRRLEVRDADDMLLCFTNPVSRGTKEHELLTWGQLLDRAGIALDTLV
ncbi:CehA/McbA family metallohydrolase [Paenibacillus sp. MBLB4367]|uniref:CehA/McbA family metallohydrolase n=1 Tax=Paenibacillus sp. MBLB4367 TaxID=3384767 RepID=UPI003908416D